MAKNDYPGISGRRLIHETVRRMINTLVSDLTEQSAKNIGDAAPASLSMVREAPALIGFSKQIHQEQQELKKFLRDHLYRHYQVARMSAKARHTIEMLFKAFHSDISDASARISTEIYSGWVSGDCRLYSWHDRPLRYP